MKNRLKQRSPKWPAGFTLAEILVVVVIIAIAALIAIPSISSAADMQVRSAANMISADLDYARGLAITHQRPYSVVFTPASESYVIQDSTGTAIAHPVRPSETFSIALTANDNFRRVNLSAANFDGSGSNAITFNYLGCPFSGLDTTAPMNSGRVTLTAGDFTLYVDIEPMTGYVTVNQP